MTPCLAITLNDASRPSLAAAWPTFTVNIARSVTMRRTKLIKSGEWSDARPLDDLAANINNFYDVASFVVLFRSASVFEALWEDKQLLTALASKCKLVSFKQGSVILRQKEKQTDPVMYIIQSGEVRTHTPTSNF